MFFHGVNSDINLSMERILPDCQTIIFLQLLELSFFKSPTSTPKLIDCSCSCIQNKNKWYSASIFHRLKGEVPSVVPSYPLSIMVPTVVIKGLNLSISDVNENNSVHITI